MHTHNKTHTESLSLYRIVLLSISSSWIYETVTIRWEDASTIHQPNLHQCEVVTAIRAPGDRPTPPGLRPCCRRPAHGGSVGSEGLQRDCHRLHLPSRLSLLSNLSLRSSLPSLLYTRLFRHPSLHAAVVIGLQTHLPLQPLGPASGPPRPGRGCQQFGSASIGHAPHLWVVNHHPVVDVLL